MKLLKIDGESGTVEQGGIRLDVNLMLVDNLQIGDYLIVHAGFAIQRMDEKEARETLNIFKDLDYDAGRS